MGEIIGKQYETDEQVQEDSRFWQELLRQGNWNITARLAQPQEMTADAFGDCDWWLDTLKANIHVLAAGFNNGNHDMENTLAHEHVHVTLTPMAWAFKNVLTQLAPSARGPLQDDFDNLLEQAVNIVAGALVALKRQAEGRTEVERE